MDQGIEDKITIVDSVNNLLTPHIPFISNPMYKGLMLIRKSCYPYSPTLHNVIESMCYHLKSLKPVPSFTIIDFPTSFLFSNGARLSVVALRLTAKGNLGRPSELVNILGGREYQRVTILEDDIYTKWETEFIRSRIRTRIEE